MTVRALRRGFGGDREDEGERREIKSDPPARPRSRVGTESEAPLGDPPVGEVTPGTYDPLADDHASEEDEDVGFADEEERSQFEYRAPFTRRRNPARMWTLAAAIFAILAMGTAVAVNYYGLPAIAPFDQPTFGIGKKGLELDFPPAQQRTETLENGEEIFRVRGTISNSGQETKSVPNLLIVFRDERERQVANWIIVPSKRDLAPGETLNVTEAIADVPPAAVVAEIGWSPA